MVRCLVFLAAVWICSEAQPPTEPAIDAESALDLGCLAVQRAEAWGDVKQKFHALYNGSSSPWTSNTRLVLQETLDYTVGLLKDSGAFSSDAGECGLGRLCLQLLALTVVDNPIGLVTFFANTEKISSPVLTALIDMPWLALASSGWPIFGFLSELSQMRSGQAPGLSSDAVDGTGDPLGQAFHLQLSAALRASDGAAVADVATAYLQQDLGSSALATMTALSAQAAAVVEPKQRMDLIQAIQSAMKQVLASGAELDIALGTRWPLWALLHVAVDPLGG